MKDKRELTRAENLQRSRLGMREDTGLLGDRMHPFSHGCTSRSLKYHPVRPPYDMAAPLPQLYRSELCEKFTQGMPKFSKGWNDVHGATWSWLDYFKTFPRRPDEINQLAYEAWAKENPEALARLDAEWDEFLKEFR